MGFLFKGSKDNQSQDSTVKLNPFIEKQAKDAARMADYVSMLGYVPNPGPVVAGLTPMQLAGMKGIDTMSKSHGMPNAGAHNKTGNALYTALTGLDAPETYAGGVRGHSAKPLVDAMIAQMPAGQREYIQSMFINPETGELPSALLGRSTGGSGSDIEKRRAIQNAIQAVRDSGRDTDFAHGQGTWSEHDLSYDETIEALEGLYDGLSDMSLGDVIGAIASLTPMGALVNAGLSLFGKSQPSAPSSNDGAYGGVDPDTGWDNRGTDVGTGVGVGTGGLY